MTTGKSLCHQKLMVWRNRAKAFSTGYSALDYYYKYVLNCLQKSLDILERKAIECFKDLGLFPENQRIPVAALVDMWAELHCEDDHVDALEKIYQLVNLNMADIIVTGYGVCFLDNLLCCMSKCNFILRPLRAIYISNYFFSLIRKFASDTVNYNYHYVTQHSLLRELEIRQTSQEPEDKRNRISISIS